MFRFNRSNLFNRTIPLIAIAFMMTPTFKVLADVGNSFSGGGSSFSSSHSYSGSRGGRTTSLEELLIESVVIIIVVLVLNGMRVISAKNKAHRVYNQTPYEFQTTVFDAAHQQIANTLYHQDHSFAEEALNRQIEQLFLGVQAAWCARDWERVRPLESLELFETHQAQLVEYQEQGLIPYLSCHKIHRIRYDSLEKDGPYEYLVVRLEATILDYVVQEQTGAVVQGSKTMPEHRAYRLTFKRTQVRPDAHHTCPRCGAELSGNISHVCDYCGSLITLNQYDWVLDGYEAWQPRA